MTTKTIRIVGTTHVATVSDPTSTVSVDTVESNIALEGYGPRSDSNILDNRQQAILADAADMLDVFTFGITRVAGEDTFNLLEAVATHATKVADEDTISTTDVFIGDDSIIQIDKRLNEQVTFIDVLSVGFTTGFVAELVSISDSNAILLGKVADTDAFATDDTLLPFSVTKGVVETVTYTDALNFGISSVLSETAIIADSLAISTTKPLTAELVTLADSGGALIQSYNDGNYFAQDYAVGTYSAF